MARATLRETNFMALAINHVQHDPLMQYFAKSFFYPRVDGNGLQSGLLTRHTQAILGTREVAKHCLSIK